MTQRPRTAWDLLSDVIKYMKKHPEEYLQEYYVARRETIRRRYPQSRCETAYCRAGLIVLLHDGEVPDLDVARRAVNILGLRKEDCVRLFSGSACQYVAGLVPPLGIIERHIPDTNSREYLRRGIRGLRTFMQCHKAHLKHRLLPEYRTAE